MTFPLPLTRPLIVLDVETTGTDPQSDRIVSLAFQRLMPDGTEEKFYTLVNPGVPIPAASTEKHGIVDADIKGMRSFQEIAGGLAPRLSLCDFAGMYVTFDLKILTAEFNRAGVRWSYDGAAVVDAHRLWALGSPRTLTDAVREFLKREPTAAHDARGDVTDALEVIVAQLRRWPELGSTVQALHDKSFPPVPGAKDGQGHIVSRASDAVVCWNRGKWKGTPLADVPKDYLQWVLKSDFPVDTKGLVQAELSRR